MRKYLIAAVLVPVFTAPAFAAEQFYLAHEPANGGGLMVPFYGVPRHPTPFVQPSMGVRLSCGVARPSSGSWSLQARRSIIRSVKN